MACDAHAHPYELARIAPEAEAERRALGVAAAASAWRCGEFEFQAEAAAAARAAGAAPLVLCFGAHPQLAALDPEAARMAADELEDLAAAGSLDAVGEIGLDLYGPANRASRPLQEELFDRQLALARRRGLPVVLHALRAIDQVFARARALAALPAVVFHSYSGTNRAAGDLLRRGVDAYFSFGTTVCLNHRTAMEAGARLPLDRLLVETDAPWQPLSGPNYPERGRAYSSWADLAEVLARLADLRRAAGSAGGDPAELEAATDANWRRVYGGA